MGLRIVQPGIGSPSRSVLFAFLFWPVVDPKIRAACGPGPCIIADDTATGTESLAELLEFAHDQAGVNHVPAYALAGYSAGCQRVRALRRAGAQAAAYLLCDGTHASWPPQDWQITWLRELAEQARAGRVLVVATHTQQSYVESLPPGKAYASTRTVLREAMGLALDEAGPLDAPALAREGSLYVYSYQSAAADLRAHAAQHSIVLPRLAGLHVAPWLAGVRSPAASRPPIASPAEDGLGLLLVAAAAAVVLVA